MRDVNKVWVLGNLGADAQYRATQDNKTMTQLLVGTSDHDNGPTEWHRVYLFGRLAQYASHLRKGARVLVEGHLQSYNWEDRQTGRRMRLISLIGHSLESLSGGVHPQAGGQRAPGRQRQYPPQAQGYGYAPQQPAGEPPAVENPAMMDPGFGPAPFPDGNDMPPPPNPAGYGWGSPGMPDGAPPGPYGYPGGMPEGSAPPPADNRQPPAPQPPRPAPSNLPTRRRGSRPRATGNRTSFDQTPYAQE